MTSSLIGLWLSKDLWNSQLEPGGEIKYNVRVIARVELLSMSTEAQRDLRCGMDVADDFQLRSVGRHGFK